MKILMRIEMDTVNKNRVHTTRVLFLVLMRIRIICCADDNGLIEVPSSPDFESAYMTAPRGASLTSIFMANWKDVNEAIEIFVQEYESQHKTVISVLPILENTQPFEAGVGMFHGIVRLKFRFRQGHLHYVPSSVIIKIPFLGPLREIGIDLLYYSKEKLMYEEIFPVMYKHWPHERFSPRFYGAKRDSNTLIIENLAESGFHATKNLLHGHEQCVEVFKSLAIFHALSSCVVNGPTLSRLELYTIRSRLNFVDHDVYSLALWNKFRKHVFPLLSSPLQSEIKHVFENLGSVLQTAYLPGVNELNVILHGDLSMTNVLFQNYNETQVAACKFVDFHNSRQGPPVIDLVNYLLNSVQFEVYYNHTNLKELLSFYVSELNRVLKVTGNSFHYDLNVLVAGIRKYKSYFIFRLISNVPTQWLNFQPVTLNEYPEDAYDFLYKSEMYIRIFKEWGKLLLDDKSIIQ